MAIKAGTLGISAEAGIYIAIDRGYMSQEGLDVELTPFRTGVDQVPLLAKGELQFGAASPDPSVFNAVNRDIPVRVVANYGGPISPGKPGANIAGFVVRSDLVDSGKYKDPKDLKGMTVSIPSLGTSGALYLDKFLARGSLTTANINEQTVPFGDLVTAMGNKKVDAAWAIQPFITLMAQRNIAKLVLPGADVPISPYPELILISPDFAKSNPEAANRFVTAFMRGQRDYWAAFDMNRGGKEDILQILARHTGQKDTSLYEAIDKDNGLGGVDPNGLLEPGPLVEFQDYYLKVGTQKQQLDMTKLIDNSYLQYAYTRLGKVS